jgi:repressor of nif and glnA expression
VVETSLQRGIRVNNCLLTLRNVCSILFDDHLLASGITSLVVKE